ncbi:MAG TPA: UDP-3-O-(3-hydroxymyristoyl)glucosamine N-acyltransferase, partial [Aquaticitalea sp.]|nr:UDP-3-O-(3-hydroxymyristoyl)glucosamine N-acyltransferase [Aquaticitalea sp.]
MRSYTIKDINELLKGELIGNTTHTIVGPEELQKATNQNITFIGSSKYVKYWENSKACAALVPLDLTIEPGDNRAFIKVKHVELAMAELLELFNPPAPVFDIDIHPTAVIHETATIGNGCKIGANCYVGKDVVLGIGVILYPNVCVFDETTIGDQTIVWSGTIIRERCIIGSRCIFHTNVSIGADGFGYRPSADGSHLVKIPQIGNVIIGNHVEIGANSCVDRAKFSSTIIGDGCK